MTQRKLKHLIKLTHFQNFVSFRVRIAGMLDLLIKFPEVWNQATGNFDVITGNFLRRSANFKA